ncbi:MAG: hypothetical protein N2646_05195 [Bellilinea sp.]|nr:hypothetical protein [Bellilinea sp.]
MRKILTFVLLIVVLGGCTLASQTPTPTSVPPVILPPPATEAPTLVPSPENPQSRMPDLCGNPYYPVVNGATYFYQLSSGENVIRTMQTDETTQKFTILVSSAGTNAKIEGQCISDGIVIMETPGSTTTTSDEEGTSTVTTQTSSGVTLPNDLAPGKQWSQTIRVVTESGESLIQSDYRAIGFEEVTVPAGTFTALKIEQNGYVTVFDQKIAMEGLVGWYVEGIGLVRFEVPGAPVSELTMYDLGD